MRTIFAEYSIVTKIFHFLDHCSLLKFGTSSREFFHLAKFELNKNHPCPIWAVTDYLISLSALSKFETLNKNYIRRTDCFSVKKGVAVYFFVTPTWVYLCIHSVLGHYLQIALNPCNHVFLIEQDHQEIVHFNSFGKTLVIFNSSAFPSKCVDISVPSSPIIHDSIYANIKREMNFALCVNLYYDLPIPSLDFLYKRIENPYLVGIPWKCSFIRTFMCTYDYYCVGSVVYQCEGLNVINKFDIGNFYSNNCLLEDRYFVTMNEYHICDFVECSVFDMFSTTKSIIVLRGHFIYLGKRCLGYVSSAKKLKILHIPTMTLYESKQTFDGYPLGCIDGDNALFTDKENNIFCINNVKDAVEFNIISQKPNNPDGSQRITAIPSN